MAACCIIIALTFTSVDLEGQRPNVTRVKNAHCSCKSRSFEPPTLYTDLEHLAGYTSDMTTYFCTVITDVLTLSSQGRSGGLRAVSQASAGEGVRPHLSHHAPAVTEGYQHLTGPHSSCSVFGSTNNLLIF